MAIDLEEVLISANELASFPAIVNRINLAVESHSYSLDQVAGIINEDPALSARLLKVANSSFYSFPQPVYTITRAITMIGMKQLRDLVYATTVMNLFTGLPEGMVDMDSFWRHSIACGVAARVIAIARRESNVERCYLVGLLHDIGRLVIYSQLPDLAVRILKRSRVDGILLHQAEQNALGFDHALLGSRLLKNWNLPPGMVLPVMYHHQPLNAEDYAVESAMVHVADIIAHGLRLGGGGEIFVPPLDPQAWQLIDLPATIAPTLFKRVREQYRDAVNLFGIST